MTLNSTLGEEYMIMTVSMSWSRIQGMYAAAVMDR